eukprot:526402_1
MSESEDWICYNNTNNTIDTVGYITFFLFLIPISYLCYLYYHRILLKSVLKHEYDDDYVIARFTGTVTNLSLIFHGIAISSMITSIILTIYIYNSYEHCTSYFNVRDGHFIMWGFSWFFGLLFYFIGWAATVQQTYDYLIRPWPQYMTDDYTKSLLNKLKKKFHHFKEFMILKVFAICVGCVFIQPLHFGLYFDGISEDEIDNFDCVCSNPNVLDVQLFGFLFFFYYIIFNCICVKYGCTCCTGYVPWIM